MKRNLLAVAVLVLAVALFFGYRSCRPGAARSASTGVTSGEGTAASAARARKDPRAGAVDPRTLTRGRISGAVRDEAGAAIAGARVCATVSNDDLASEDTREPTCAIADAAGAYALVDLVAGSYDVFASAPRFVPRRWHLPHRYDGVRLAAGETRTGIDFALEGGAVEVRGVVSDIGGGPIAAAQVTVASGDVWNRDELGGFIKTDEEGRFTAWARGGDIHVTASADGYTEGSKDGVAPGRTIEVLLTPEGGLSGVVVEAGTRTPVAGAMVTVDEDQDSWYGSWSEHSARSDAEGRFRLTRLSPGRYKPEARGVGVFGQAGESVLLGLGQSVGDVVVEVHRAAVVSGRIVVDDGKGGTRPCERGWVSLRDDKHDHDAFDGSDPDGTITLRAVLPGTYSVSVQCSDFMPLEKYDDVVVASKDVTDLVWTVSAGGTVRGRVLTVRGTPVAGADVRASRSGGDPRAKRNWKWARSEKDGSFELRGVAAGSYSLDASHDRQPPRKDPLTVEVPPGGEVTADVTFDDSGSIRGVVVDDRGKPVAGAKVKTTSDRWSWAGDGTGTRDDGSFVLDGVPAGEHRVVAIRGEWDEMRKPNSTDDDVQGERVTVAAGQSASVRLVVESQSGTIRGDVVDDTGKPVGDAYVLATRESDAAGAAAGGALRDSRWSFDKKPVVTGVDGNFTVKDLSPGAYTVRAYRRGGGEAVAEHVAVGGRAHLIMKATGAIRGTVALADGSSPDEFSVVVWDRAIGFSRSEQFFRRGGAFAMNDVPGGNFEIAVNAPEGRATTTVALRDGEDKAGVKLTLEATATVRGRLVELGTGAPVPGMRMAAMPARGGGNYSFRWDDAGPKKYISAADGSFELERVPVGKVNLRGFPVDFDKAPYELAMTVVTVPPGESYDVGTIEVVRRRLGRHDKGGDLGFELVEPAADADLDQRVLKVSAIRKGGPAEKSGLKVGDVIVSVDGHDVRGPHIGLWWSLGRNAPPGTPVHLGLERGAGVTVVAGQPL